MADDKSTMPELLQALAFIDKVKDRSTAHPNLSDDFLNAAKDYRNEMVDSSGKPKGPEFDMKQHTNQFIAKIEALFQDEPDLLEEWRPTFFPNMEAGQTENRENKSVIDNAEK